MIIFSDLEQCRRWPHLCIALIRGRPRHVLNTSAFLFELETGRCHFVILLFCSGSCQAAVCDVARQLRTQMSFWHFAVLRLWSEVGKGVSANGNAVLPFCCFATRDRSQLECGMLFCCFAILLLDTRDHTRCSRNAILLFCDFAIRYSMQSKCCFVVLRFCDLRLDVVQMLFCCFAILRSGSGSSRMTLCHFAVLRRPARSAEPQNRKTAVPENSLAIIHIIPAGISAGRRLLAASSCDGAPSWSGRVWPFLDGRAAM